MPASCTMKVPYDTKTFHTISHLIPVRIELEQRKGQQFVQDVLGPIFARHGLQDEIGVSLVHRHFDIGPEEKLVEFNNVTVPWVVRSEINQVSDRNSLVYETSWMLDENHNWMAYEYAYSPNGSLGKTIVQLEDGKYADFLAEYTETLRNAGYDRMFGLRAWPGQGFRGGLEISQEHCNILLKPEEFLHNWAWNYTETMWFWNREWLKARCVCECGWPNGFHITHDHVSG